MKITKNRPVGQGILNLVQFLILNQVQCTLLYQVCHVTLLPSGSSNYNHIQLDGTGSAVAPVAWAQAYLCVCTTYPPSSINMMEASLCTAFGDQFYTNSQNSDSNTISIPISIGIANICLWKLANWSFSYCECAEIG